MTTATCGINVNGDGDVVGIWVQPERVVMDEYAYIDLTLAEMRSLGFQITIATHDEGI